MATYTKTYPNTGSTLKIEYPDGVFKFVGDATEWYQDDDVLQSMQEDGYEQYPDVIFIPEKGAYINQIVKYETTIYKSHVIKYDQLENTWETETIGDSTASPEEPSYVPGYPDEEEDFLWLDSFWNEKITMKKDDCMGEPYFFSLYTNQLQEDIQKQKDEENRYDNMSSYSYDETHVTVTIEAEANKFKSNVDQYFCTYSKSSESETKTNEHAYFSSRFKVRNFVGFIAAVNKDPSKTFVEECVAVNLSSFTKKKSKNKKATFNSMSTLHIGADGAALNLDRNTRLSKQSIMCDGFTWDTNTIRNSTFSSNTYNILDSEQIFFGIGQFMVCFSLFKDVPMHSDGMYFDNAKFFKFQLGNSGGKKTLSVVEHEYPHIEKLPGETLTSDQKVLNDISFNKTVFDGRGGSGFGNDTIFILGSLAFQNILNSGFAGRVYISSPRGIIFNNHFTSNNSNGKVICKGTQIPIGTYGTTIFPILTIADCSYFYFRCNPDTDPFRVVSLAENIDDSIVAALEANYKNNHLRWFKNNWEKNQDILKSAIKNVKNNMSRFKIIYVGAHGGKNKNNDKSYALLDADVGNRNTSSDIILEYDHFKYLLQNRKDNEYYLIFLLPCFSGGLLENFVHNDVTRENYSQVVPSQELGTNCIIAHSDCANSPAWVSIRHILFDFKSNLTYSQQVMKFNSTIETVRKKNIQYIVDFLKRGYPFLTKMLDMSKLKWTDETFKESIENAENLIMKLSRTKHKGNEAKDMIETYPIIMLIKFISNLFVYNEILSTLDSWGTPCQLEQFSSWEFWYKPFVDSALGTFDPYLNTTSRWSLQSMDPDKLSSLNFFQTWLSNPKPYFKFFYDLYSTCCYPIMDNITKNFATGTLDPKNIRTQWLLDDKPGMVDYGGFGDSKFPFFPGMQDGNIDEDLIKSIYFK